MKKYILIIENDKKMAQLLAKKLSIEGYETSLAYDGLRGFINAQEQNPAVILLNHELPSMSSLEVVRQLRTRGVTAQ
ncbi:MAG: response regulator, partial [Bacteroidota bacterium]